MVMGDGRFERSWVQIPMHRWTFHFFTLICCKKLYCLLEKTKNKRKRGRVWPIFLKKYAIWLLTLSFKTANKSNCWNSFLASSESDCKRFFCFFKHSNWFFQIFKGLGRVLKASTMQIYAVNFILGLGPGCSSLRQTVLNPTTTFWS